MRANSPFFGLLWAAGSRLNNGRVAVVMVSLLKPWMSGNPVETSWLLALQRREPNTSPVPIKAHGSAASPQEYVRIQ
jgi:hypothetical protein